jgi:hypothetical protein
MAQVYFHYSNAEGEWTDQRAAAVVDLVEARDLAALVVHSLIMAPNTEDWRRWHLHVSDDSGVEIFTLPFASMLGRPH